MSKNRWIDDYPTDEEIQTAYDGASGSLRAARMYRDRMGCTLDHAIVVIEKTLESRESSF